MTCAKTVVKARLLCRNGKFYDGENACLNPQAICPRKPGEGYLPCINVCKQPFHAEIAAILKAMDDITEVRGGKMTVFHDKVCEHCRDVMKLYEITWECVA
jgi:hypothetical protein